MAVLSGASWNPKSVGGRPKRRKGRCVVLHVAVSEAQNLKPGANADWHFYVAKNGAIYQYLDTDLQSWATGAANATAISVETQGGVRNADSEPWTEAQVQSLAKICRWAHDTEGVPLQLMPDSRPDSRGIGYHRLGVDPWRVSGGEVWSSARGKICPGAAKIAQIPRIIAIASGKKSTDLGGTAPGMPIPLGDDEMIFAQTPDGTIWKITDYDVSPEPGIYRFGALAKARGAQYVKLSREELLDNVGDANDRRARLLTDIARAAGGDVDEELILAKLIPAITEAVAGRTGATREEIADLLKGITLRAS